MYTNAGLSWSFAFGTSHQAELVMEAEAAPEEPGEMEALPRTRQERGKPTGKSSQTTLFS